MEKNKRVAYISIFIGLAVSLGYLLSPVPNVELITTAIFLGGYLTDIFSGGVIGALSFLIYGYFNPFGSSPLPLLISQITGGIIIGITGSLCKRFNKISPVFLAVVGFLVTSTYDIITSASGFIFFPSKKTFLAYIIAGLSFSLIHIISNTLIFGSIVFLTIKRLKRRFL